MRMKPKSTVHNPRALLYKRFTDLETSIASGRVVLYHTDDGKYWVFSAEMVKFFEFTGDPATVPEERKISAGGITSQVFLRFANIYYVYIITNGVGKWVVTRNNGESGSEIICSYTNIQVRQFAAQEPLNNRKMPSNPIPANITITTTAELNYITILVVESTGNYAAYRLDFEDDVGSGTFTIPKVNIVIPDDELQQYKDKITIIADKEEDFEVDSWDLEVTIPTLQQETLSAKFADIGRYQTNKYYLAGSFDYMIRGSIGSSDTQPIKGNIMHLRSFEIKYFDDSINIDHDDLVVIDGHLYGVEDLAYDIKRSPKPYTVYFATLNNIK